MRTVLVLMLMAVGCATTSPGREAELQFERECYVVLEDPAATPEARGHCRQALNQLAERRAARERYRAAVVAGAIARQR